MKLSVVIPAYNEEKFIGNVIESIHTSCKDVGIDYEIIVANNNSTDKTAEIAKSLGAKVVLEQIRSISRVRNTGASKASGDLLLFIDADSVLNSRTLKKAVDQIQNRNRKGVGCLTHFDKYPTLVSLGVWFYNLASYILNIGAGHFLLLSRGAFEDVGKFDEHLYACEDIALSKKIKQVYGEKSFFVILDIIKTSSRKFEKEKDSTEFFFQLLGGLLGKRTGRNKERLNFWYGNQDKISGFNSGLYYFLIILLAGDVYSTVNNISISSITNSSLTLLVFIIFMYLLRPPIGSSLIFGILVLVAEILGSKTGVLFGNYTYLSNLDFSILYVPIYIPLAWILIVYSAWQITKSFWKTGILSVLIDAILEKFAVSSNLWTWDKEYLLFSPLLNYLTWFVIAIIGALLFKNSKNKNEFMPMKLIITLLIYINAKIGLYRNSLDVITIVLIFYIIFETFNTGLKLREDE